MRAEAEYFLVLLGRINDDGVCRSLTGSGAPAQRRPFREPMLLVGDPDGKLSVGSGTWRYCCSAHANRRSGS
jgi:hypothetical protein